MVAWNKGLKMSPELVEKNRLAHIGLKASAETKAKMSLVHKGNKSRTGMKNSPEAIAKMSKARKGKKFSQQHKDALKEVWKDPQYKEGMSRKHLGNKSRTGLANSPEARAKIGEAHTGKVHTEKWRKNQSLGLLGKPKSAEHKAKLREARINPETFDAWNKACLKASHVKPNGKEIFMMGLLNSLFPDQYKYVGDGEVIIGGKNPDFININGQKKVIEYYGDRWHQGDNPQDRIDIFAQYGFDCLIIWGSELKNMDRVAKRLKIFHEKIG
jgi:hypothetical protein